MKSPKASFVIPAYNAEAFLAQAILSCRAQSVKEIEIIVVDNGSTDGTEELVRWHVSQDKRVRYEICPFQKNRSAARNHGNFLANAPFIFVLDSDDLACKNRVRDGLIVFQMKNPDVIYGPFEMIDEHGQHLGNQKAGTFNRETALATRHNFIGHSTMAYRKGVTMNVQYDEGDYSRLGLDDWHFQWECVLKGYKFGVCSTMQSKYRLYQLPNKTYGSPTEFYRNPEEVKQ